MAKRASSVGSKRSAFSRDARRSQGRIPAGSAGAGQFTARAPPTGDLPVSDNPDRTAPAAGSALDPLMPQPLVGLGELQDSPAGGRYATPGSSQERSTEVTELRAQLQEAQRELLEGRAHAHSVSLQASAQALLEQQLEHARAEHEAQQAELAEARELAVGAARAAESSSELHTGALRAVHQARDECTQLQARAAKHTEAYADVVTRAKEVIGQTHDAGAEEQAALLKMREIARKQMHELEHVNEELATQEHTSAEAQRKL